MGYTFQADTEAVPTVSDQSMPPEVILQDEFTDWMMSPAGGFIAAKRLPDGTYIGLQRLLFTLALCIGVTPDRAYTRRFCYEDMVECMHQFNHIISGDAEPTGWVARRPPAQEDELASTVEW